MEKNHSRLKKERKKALVYELKMHGEAI